MTTRSSHDIRRIVVDDDTTHSVLRIDGVAHPIANYTHLLAPEGIVVAWAGPMVSALYQTSSLTSRQCNLIKTTLKRDPDALHKLFERTRHTTDYRVLFRALPYKNPPKRRRR